MKWDAVATMLAYAVLLAAAGQFGQLEDHHAANNDPKSYAYRWVAYLCLLASIIPFVLVVYHWS